MKKRLKKGWIFNITSKSFWWTAGINNICHTVLPSLRRWSEGVWKNAIWNRVVAQSCLHVYSQDIAVEFGLDERITLTINRGKIVKIEGMKMPFENHSGVWMKKTTTNTWPSLKLKTSCTLKTRLEVNTSWKWRRSSNWVDKILTRHLYPWTSSRQRGNIKIWQWLR